MNSLDITKSYPLDYELADNLDITTDQELIDIINHNYDCEMCGLTRVGRP